MLAAAEHTILNGSDSSILLGVMAGMGALLFVFLLYLNKKWWWGTAVGAMSCCDEACPPMVSSRPVLTPPLLQERNLPPKNKFVKTYSFDGGDSSSESELGAGGGHHTTTSPSAPNHHSNHHNHHHHHQHQHNNNLGLPPTPSSQQNHVTQSPPAPSQQLVTSSSSGGGGGGGGTTSTTYYTTTTNGGITTTTTTLSNNNGGGGTAVLRTLPPPHHHHHDLMSMVEKGRLMAAGMSSNSSCCSSTTSSVGGGITGEKSKGSVVTHQHQMTTTDGGNGDEEMQQQQQMMGTVQVEHHRSPVLRETKIDNQENHYQKIEQNHHLNKGTDINCNRDCIVVMNTEGENSELVSTIGSEGGGDQQTVSKCGHLEIALLYDAPMRKMTVHVLQARDIPSRDRGQPTHTQVRLILLPSKKQKHKSKIRSGENPQYTESFLLHRVNPEDVNSMGIRLRVYGCERMRRERLIGEAIVSFANINLELENNFWLNLEPRANTTLAGCTAELMSLARSDSTGSTHSMQHGGVPELLLGLCYNATTGRLNIEVVKGSHFRNLALNRAPDTYVKLHLVSSTGQELAQSKTTVRRGQPNPLFKETFVFQVALFQLADVTLMAAVYNRRGVTKKKEMVGWFSLGLNSSGAEELAHWMDMKEFQQEQICRWHVLVQS